MRISPRRNITIVLVAAMALTLAAAAFRNAVRYYGHSMVGVFVDPDGVVSDLGLPTWSGIRAGLRFPNRIIEIDGVRLDRFRGGRRAQAFDAAIERARESGKTAVHARVATAYGERSMELPIEALSAPGWWTYAGSLHFAGGLYLIAGILALWVSPESPVARSFAELALASFTFLATLFDFHTTRMFVPLFFVAFALLPMTLFVLPMRLPDDIRLIRRFPWIVRGLYALGAALGLCAATVYVLGGMTTGIQIFFSRLLGSALVFFALTFALRFLRARDRRRQILKIFSLTTVLPHALIGAAIVLSAKGPLRSTIDLVSMPTLALTPLAMVVAFVRHDAWSSRALLSRITARFFIGVVACILAIGIGAIAAIDLAHLSFSGALVGSTAGAVVAAALVSFALAAGDRTFFPSLAKYKPTVEQLSEELTSIACPEDVARAIERTVRRWLPCDRIRLLLVEPALSERIEDSAERRRIQHGSEPELQSDPFDKNDESPPSGAQRVARKAVQDRRRAVLLEAGRDHVTISVCFQGRLLGQLQVGQKRGGALFTTEDMDLLQTIANQGALALAHAAAYAELEERRRTQLEAWRGEREALLETVAAEIAHEVRYPINFFRSIFRSGSAGAGLLDAEDIEIGCEEVDRLERLVSGLKRLAAPRINPRRLRVADLCTRAEVLLRDALGARRIHVEIAEPSEIDCDIDKATQILVNLLANALDAAGMDGRVGVRWSMKPSGDAVLAVWDDGPGFKGDPSHLFAPWYTTKPRGTGLGLAITQRLVRAHGWSIDAYREKDHTMFAITVPSSAVRDEQERGVA